MGGMLARAAIRRGHSLPLTPYKCPIHMAVTIMPDNTAHPIYYGGRDALVRAVYGTLAPKGKRRETQYKVISHALKKLREAGLISAPLNDAHEGKRAEYELILTEPAEGVSTAHPLGTSDDAEGVPTNDAEGVPTGEREGVPTEHPKEATTGSNKQEASADSARQMEAVVETEQPTAVGLHSSASSISKNQLTTRVREASGNDLEIDGKKQDQKRCKHHPCGVYESQHHRLAEFGIEPHNFTWWPDNDPKPDERKRARRNYAVQNRYQNQKQKTPRKANP